MRGDFSRLVLDDAVASRVLQQQGRVSLDADWNDALAVLLRGQRLLAADLIGPHGGPRPDAGYEVSRHAHDDVADLALGEGIYYVDGMRVEARRPVEGKILWSEQPYPPWLKSPRLHGPPYLVYLDVWERHVASVQDDSMREVALGGPDTTSRAEIVWQVRVAAAAADDLAVECGDFPLESWRRGLVGTPPRLRAWAKRVDDDEDSCLADPNAGYRGVGDQLYRVEITDVDGDRARFVWSRDNGSVVAAWTGVENDELLVDGLRDSEPGFSPGDWLELTWDQVEVAGEPGPRVQVVAVDGRRVTYDTTTTTAAVPADPSQLTHPIARRWDARPGPGVTMVGGAVDITEGDDDNNVIPLEEGISIQFGLPPDGQGPTRYRVGDYWTMPARVATGDIIWPRDASGAPLAVAPQGVEHHYAPLALVTDGASANDLRHLFDPIATCS